MWQRLLVLIALTCALWLSDAKGEKMTSVDKLISDLQSEDGMKRVGATHSELYAASRSIDSACCGHEYQP
jgi:hypothetical protein